MVLFQQQALLGRGGEPSADSEVVHNSDPWLEPIGQNTPIPHAKPTQEEEVEEVNNC